MEEKTHSKKLNGAQGHRACKVNVWLGTQGCVYTENPVFPPYLSAIQAFLHYTFWPKGVYEDLN